MVLVGESFSDAKAQVTAEVTCEPRMLLKTSWDGAAPVSLLVSFAAVRGRPQRIGLGHSSRSQTILTCRERTPADLGSMWGDSSRS
jgi:hypothetical protein